MYKQGDIIIYRGNGVCRVDEIKDISFYHERPQKHYILKPMFTNQQELVLYVPYNNEKLVAKMQPVISKKEAKELIDSINDSSVEWIEDRNQRKDVYGEIILGDSRKDITSVIGLISRHRVNLEAEGKHLNMQDEKLLNEAERRMKGEFAVALGIEFDDVEDLIMSKVNG